MADIIPFKVTSKKPKMKSQPYQAAELTPIQKASLDKLRKLAYELEKLRQKLPKPILKLIKK
jgi:hypothetical protein